MSTVARQPARLPSGHLPALAAALLLAVLIPLACIRHCQLHDARHSAATSAHAQRPASHRHAAPAEEGAAGGYTPSGHDHRLCGMHAADEALAYPQAIYDLIPLVAPLLSLIALALGAAIAHTHTGAAAAARTPLTPPPQLAPR